MSRKRGIQGEFTKSPITPNKKKIVRVPVLRVPAISALGTRGTGEDSVISALGTLGTGEDSDTSAPAAQSGLNPQK